MPITLFTDPHLGLKRSTGFTVESSIALSNKILDAAGYIVTSSKHPVFCLGDLFDSYSNNEKVVLDGYNVAKKCAVVLAGNHDIQNRAGAFGSLQLLQQLFSVAEEDLGEIPLIVAAPVIDPCEQAALLDDWHRDFITIYPCDDTIVYLVPHVITQAGFIKILSYLADEAVVPKEPTPVLMLHCNVSLNFEASDSTLNLPMELAERLLNKFARIFVGHEHVPRKLFNGRLVVLGNIHPTSFADNVSDKYIYTYDGSTDALLETKVWSWTSGYASMDCTKIRSTEAEFISVTGKVRVEELHKLGKEIAWLWRVCPNLLAIQDKVEVEGAMAEDFSDAPIKAFLSLPELIAKALSNQPELLRLWEKISVQDIRS